MVSNRELRVLPFVLLTIGGGVTTAAGAAALNFDVLVLEAGCVVGGVVGIRRRRKAAAEDTPWQG